MKEKELKLEIEELEERIAPTFLIEPPGNTGNTHDVSPANMDPSSPPRSNGMNTQAAWNADHTSLSSAVNIR